MRLFNIYNRWQFVTIMISASLPSIIIEFFFSPEHSNAPPEAYATPSISEAAPENGPLFAVQCHYPHPPHAHVFSRGSLDGLRVVRHCFRRNRSQPYQLGRW